MSDLNAKMHQNRFRLGELTALPQAFYLDLRGPTSKRNGRVQERGEARVGKGKKGGKGREGAGEGRKNGGRGRGKKRGG